MILTERELRAVYEAIVKPFGHPDPIGYMTRALLMSGGDTEYYDVDGKIGFMPIDPAVALETLGVQDVSTLEGNLGATLTLDQMYFAEYGSVSDMVVAFHFGRDAVDVELDDDAMDLLNAIEEARPDVREIISPPRAKVQDVIRIIYNQLSREPTPKKSVLNLVTKILEK